jgi:hypothetical protein
VSLQPVCYFIPGMHSGPTMDFFPELAHNMKTNRNGIVFGIFISVFLYNIFYIGDFKGEDKDRGAHCDLSVADYLLQVGALKQDEYIVSDGKGFQLVELSKQAVNLKSKLHSKNFRSNWVLCKLYYNLINAYIYI